MALVNPGPIGNLSGAVGGITFAQSRYGTIARLRTPHSYGAIRPQANVAGLVIGNLQAAQAAWRQLTPDDIAAWTAAAQTFPEPDRFGRRRPLPVRNFFIKYTAFRLWGGALGTNPPPVADPPTINIDTIGFSIQTSPLLVRANWAPLSQYDDTEILIYASTHWKDRPGGANRLRRIVGWGNGVATTVNMTALWQQTFGLAIPGQHVRFTLIQGSRTGPFLAPQTFDVIAT